MIPMTKIVKVLSEKDKQTQPMDGETAPQDAFTKARVFAQQAAQRMKNKNRK